MLRANRRASDGEWLKHTASTSLEAGAGCAIQLVSVNGAGAQNARECERPLSLTLSVSVPPILGLGSGLGSSPPQTMQRKLARGNGTTARERAEYKLTVLCVGMIMLFLMGASRLARYPTVPNRSILRSLSSVMRIEYIFL